MEERGFKMTRKTRTWLGWLSLDFGVIITIFIVVFFSSIRDHSITVVILSVVIARILASIFWIPANYDPVDDFFSFLKKQKAQ